MKTLISLLTLFVMAAPAGAADLTGTWNAEVNVAGNTGTPEFTFKQDGDTLTGTYKGLLGEAPVKGKVEGQKVRWEISGEYSGERYTIVYTGTLESDDVIKGKVDFAGQADGTFVARKAK